MAPDASLSQAPSASRAARQQHAAVSATACKQLPQAITAPQRIAAGRLFSRSGCAGSLQRLDGKRAAMCARRRVTPGDLAIANDTQRPHRPPPAPAKDARRVACRPFADLLMPTLDADGRHIVDGLLMV